jgi:hypothetical protein
VLHQWLKGTFCGTSCTDGQPALRIAGDRVLDLDHLRTPVGQDGTGRGREGKLRDLDYLHTPHRL